MPKATKMKKVVDNPTAPSNTGKVSPMIKFAIHRQKTLIPTPSPLTLIGKISEITSHVTGSTAPCINAINITVKVITTYGSAAVLSKRIEAPPISNKEVVALPLLTCDK